MDSSCFQHLLSDDEASEFEERGFLVLPAVLTEEMLAALQQLAAEHDREFRADPSVSEYAVLNLHDCVGRADPYLDLVDWPQTLPKVWGILGWNIQVFHTQLIVTPPTHPAATPGAYGWHQDNNRMNLDIEIAPPHPRVSVKVGYLLSDAPEPGMGGLAVVPGSHRWGRPPGEGGDVRGAVEVCGRAGDAVLFDRRIWHSATTNTSPATRSVLMYGYAHRWLRPKSEMSFEPGFLAALDPVRRQLLGWATSANGYFDPTPDDVPLREWIREHLGEAAARDRMVVSESA
jgi:ectoine hydroxylase